MLKSLPLIVVFFLGVFLAFLYSFRGSIFFKDPDLVVATNIDKQVKEKNAFGQSSIVSPINSEIEAWVKAMMDVSPEVRSGIMVSAIEEGSLASLKQIRPEYLHALPAYKEELLPLIRTRALEQLVYRFLPEDWNNWENSIESRAGGPTQANEYVRNVSLVNPELGKYLETAAWLFSLMYKTIMSGEVFDEQKAMKDLLSHSSFLFANRKVLAVSPAEMFDTNIISDSSFIAIFERLRGDLFKDFFDMNQNEFSKQAALIRTLKPEYCSPEAIEAVRLFIEQLTTRASKEYRKKIINSLLESDIVKSFSKSSFEGSLALSQLFAVAAVDEIEAGDKKAAEKLLNVSLGLNSGLKTQEHVKNYLYGKSNLLVPALVSIEDYIIPKNENVILRFYRWLFMLDDIVSYIFLVFILGFGIVVFVSYIKSWYVSKISIQTAKTESDDSFLPDISTKDINSDESSDSLPRVGNQ